MSIKIQCDCIKTFFRLKSHNCSHYIRDISNLIYYHGPHFKHFNWTFFFIHLNMEWSKTERVSLWKVKHLAPSKQIDSNDRHNTLKHLFCISNYLAWIVFFSIAMVDSDSHLHVPFNRIEYWLPRKTKTF